MKSSRSKRPKTLQSSGKVMTFVVIFFNCIENGQTINSNSYVAQLVPLKEEIAKIQKRCYLFHNASMKTIAKIYGLYIELLLHSPYLPDLAPIDFNQFADFKKKLVEKRFRSNKSLVAVKVNRYTIKVSKCYRSFGMILSILKESMLIKYVEFCQK